ncbi:hypothetical protein ACHHYP_01537 [Achlya hypogyna]|uniref:TatD related DNase n=1 Tax=Achlya hypogyna TaxID=1202772 RepID=A0A1V9Z8P6_ACHHY|nr:hypothetical protein ACHHYP_01537 [Achlya hypogyna]
MLRTGAWVDAHCHLQDPRLRARARDILARATREGVVAISSCACTETEWADWPAFLAEVETPPVQLLPAFGVHPWYAGDVSPTYLSTLEDTLKLYPNASVGEIGLCKSKRGAAVPMTIQEARFREQLQLAGRLKRPVVVHCVGAYGKVLDIVNAASLARPVVLHSFSGAAEMVHSFCRLRGACVYFSINTKMFTHDKALKMLQVIPLDRLLLETDAPDQLPPQHLPGVTTNEPMLLPSAAAALATTLGISSKELAERTTANAFRAYGVETMQ